MFSGWQFPSLVPSKVLNRATTTPAKCAYFVTTASTHLRGHQRSQATNSGAYPKPSLDYPPGFLLISAGPIYLLIAGNAQPQSASITWDLGYSETTSKQLEMVGRRGR